MSQFYRSKVTIALILQAIAIALYFVLTTLLSENTIATTLPLDLVYGIGGFALALLLYLFSRRYQA